MGKGNQRLRSPGTPLTISFVRSWRSRNRGRPLRGLMPIRGHSGVQGGAEAGCVPQVEPWARDRWGEVWRFPVTDAAGFSAAEQVEASARGEIDVFWMVGGNFLETLPNAARGRAALEKPRLRIHQDIVLSSAMLLEPSDTVLLLTAATRYETSAAKAGAPRSPESRTTTRP